VSLAVEKLMKKSKKIDFYLSIYKNGFDREFCMDRW